MKNKRTDGVDPLVRELADAAQDTGAAYAEFKTTRAEFLEQMSVCQVETQSGTLESEQLASLAQWARNVSAAAMRAAIAYDRWADAVARAARDKAEGKLDAKPDKKKS